MKRVVFVSFFLIIVLLSFAVVVSADGYNTSSSCSQCSGTVNYPLVENSTYTETRSCCTENCCQPCADCCQNDCRPAQPTCGDASGTYCVRYHENNCLESVPIDTKVYRYGETVTVLFDPVIYKSGLIFYGWSHYPYGPTHYGYAYNQFRMPAKNVDLYAICITPYYGPQTNCRDCNTPNWPNDWPNGWPHGVVP